MRSLHFITIVICFLVTLSECAFTSATIVEIDQNSQPDDVFYSGESLFIVFQAEGWGEQPIISKIDPTTGEYLVNFTIPFPRCDPCAPMVFGIQVFDDFVAVAMGNYDTLWQVVTIDTEQLVLLDTYNPTILGYIESFLVNGADSIIICFDNVNYSYEQNTYLITYGEHGHNITSTQVYPTKPSEISELVDAVINIVPNMTLGCIPTTTNNFVSIETPTGNIARAVNYGWGDSCPTTSVSFNLQGICAYYTIPKPTQQALWCWNYTHYENVIPPTPQQFTQPNGIVHNGVADDSGNFIGCYSDVENPDYDFLIQFSVNYNQSTYDVVSTAPIKDGYSCASRNSVINYSISSTLSQVAQLVTKSSHHSGVVYAYLLVNYDSA